MDSRNRAELAEGPITVNGQTIDNRTEEYPLLSFRNITYFPLTWRYDARLPEYAANNGFAVYKGYYYFAETDGPRR